MHVDSAAVVVEQIPEMTVRRPSLRQPFLQEILETLYIAVGVLFKEVVRAVNVRCGRDKGHSQVNPVLADVDPRDARRTAELDGTNATFLEIFEIPTIVTVEWVVRACTMSIWVHQGDELVLRLCFENLLEAVLNAFGRVQISGAEVWIVDSICRGVLILSIIFWVKDLHSALEEEDATS